MASTTNAPTISATSAGRPTEADPSPERLPARPPRTSAAPSLASSASLAIGGLLVLVGASLHDRGGEDDQAFVRSLDGHLPRWAASHVLQALGFLALLVGTGALLRLARHGGAGRRLTIAGAVIAAAGAIGSVFETISHGYLAYALGGRSDVPTALSTRIQLDFGHLPWVAPFFAGTLVLEAGFALAAIGLLRQRAVPRWSAVLLLLSPIPVLFAGAGPAALLGLAPFTVAAAAIALASATS